MEPDLAHQPNGTRVCVNWDVERFAVVRAWRGLTVTKLSGSSPVMVKVTLVVREGVQGSARSLRSLRISPPVFVMVVVTFKFSSHSTLALGADIWANSSLYQRTADVGHRKERPMSRVSPRARMKTFTERERIMDHPGKLTASLHQK